jgi:hypothetical protein
MSPLLEAMPPNKLHMAPAMPSSPPPPPPPTQEAPGVPLLATPSRIPAVTATQATPPRTSRAESRSPSPDQPPSRAKLQPNRLQPRHPSPNSNPRGRSVSAQPPLVRNLEADGSRAVSNPIHVHSELKPPSEGSPPGTADKRKRRSWFPGVRSRANSDVSKPRGPGAWLLSPDNQAEYHTAPLVNGEKVRLALAHWFSPPGRDGMLTAYL